MAETVLRVAGISKRFGGLQALSDVGITIERGQVYGLIGPNGAGKTTLFNLITGTIPPSEGSIVFDGVDLGGFKPDRVARAGLIRTFQAATIFGKETVRENLRRGALFGQLGKPAWFLHGGLGRKQAHALRKADEFLEFLELGDVADQPGGTLPYGKQKILGVGIALCAMPKQLLMDEPAAGLNPNETQAMGRLIARIRREFSTGIILVEHDVAMVCNTCDRIVVLNQGKVLADGTPDAIRSNPVVIEAYLGGDDFDV